MLAIGIPALRKIAIHFLIAAFCIVGGSVCQALGKSLYSFFTSVLRQVVALIPAAYLLSLTGNVGNVWWCFPDRGGSYRRAQRRFSCAARCEIWTGS